MIFSISLKTPDCLDSINYLNCGDEQKEECLKLAKKFITYNEYACLQFDTDKGTCIVLQNGK